MNNLSLMLSAIPLICGFIIVAQLGYDLYQAAAQSERYNKLMDSLEDPECLGPEDYPFADMVLTSRLGCRETTNHRAAARQKERCNMMFWVGIIPIANFALITCLINVGITYPTAGVIGLYWGILSSVWAMLFVYRFYFNARRAERLEVRDILCYATITTLELIGVIIAFALIIMFASYLVRASHRYIFNILGG